MNRGAAQNPTAHGCQFGNDVGRENIKAVLLVGGKGTRLQSVLSSKPKPLAAIGNSSLLELLVQQLRNQAIRNLVMCVGYLADQIEERFGDGCGLEVSIKYSKESVPLGTAGAIKFAQQHLQESTDFLVLNGDSLVEIDFRQLIEFHRAHRGLVSMAVSRVHNAARYGTVEVDSSGRVIRFAEKTGRDLPGLINAGVYVFSRGLFERIPEGCASLERDIFPRLLDHGIYALEQHGMFIDIGTPEDYARAQRLCNRLHEATFQKQ